MISFSLLENSFLVKKIVAMTSKQIGRFKKKIDLQLNQCKSNPPINGPVAREIPEMLTIKPIARACCLAGKTLERINREWVG